MFQQTVATLINRLTILEQNIWHTFRFLANPPGPPTPAILVAAVNSVPAQPRDSAPSPLLQEAILWNKQCATSIELRRTRRFGSDRGTRKLLPVKKLLLCLHCGNPHEPGLLCPTCYRRVEEVTDALHSAFQDKFGNQPIEKEMLPVYQGETPPPHTSRLVVEVPKPRPGFFCHNLKTPSTPANPESTAVDIVPNVKVMS